MTHRAPARAVMVGGGFVGVACARKLASDKDLQVTLIDKNDYHQVKTRRVVWGGGLMAEPIAAASGLPQGRGAASMSWRTSLSRGARVSW